MISTSGHEGSESMSKESDKDRFHGYLKSCWCKACEILQKLAIDEDNCRVMTNTHGTSNLQQNPHRPS
uniref:Uncharacterized protein n=1 Tax=Arundo donax TaxID=35708 RepID=A0A0A9A011_ARUDO